MSSSGNSRQRQRGYPAGLGISYPPGTEADSQERWRRRARSFADRFAALVPPISTVVLTTEPPRVDVIFATGRESEMRASQQFTEGSLTNGSSIILLPNTKMTGNLYEEEITFGGSALFVRKPGNGENFSDAYHRVSGTTTTRLSEETLRTRLRLVTHGNDRTVLEAFVEPNSGWTAMGPHGHMPCLSGVLHDVTTMPYDDWLLKTTMLAQIPKLSEGLPDVRQEIRTHMQDFYFPDRNGSNFGNFTVEYPPNPLALPENALEQSGKNLEVELSKIMPVTRIYTGSGRNSSHITVDFHDRIGLDTSTRPLGVGSIRKGDTVLMFPQGDFTMDGSRGMRSIGPSLLLVHRQDDNHDPSVDYVYTDVEGSTTLIGRRTQYQQTSRGTRRLPRDVSTSLYLRSKGADDWVCITTKPGASWKEMGRLGHMPYFHGTVETVEVCPI